VGRLGEAGVSVFEYPVRGRRIEADGRPLPYLTSPDGLVYRPIISVAVTAPQRRGVGPYRWANMQVDTGADCCFLKQWLADDLGIPRTPGAFVREFATASGRLSAWFAEVAFRLGYPHQSSPFEWVAPVGFVRDDQLPESSFAGILGVGGGLERFLRTELVLSPAGAEMPVVRIATPDP
jgi:Aspartyl protease